MIRCIAVDDEPLALNILEDFISKVPFLTLVKKCRSGFEAIEVLQQESIDLIFLDIQMPHITGVQLLRSLKSRAMVIFTTAYDQFALEGYNLDVLDYLLKPIPFDRFMRAVNKAYETHELRKKVSIPQPAVPVENTLDYLFVKSDYRIVKVDLRDIRYVEGLKDYVKIYAGDKPILTLQSLKALEEKLPSSQFMRVHRSYIVSLSKIEAIQKNRIYIHTKIIPVGESYVEAFQAMINKRNL
jgi:two-component system, LytTR family, response regulator